MSEPLLNHYDPLQQAAAVAEYPELQPAMDAANNLHLTLDKADQVPDIESQGRGSTALSSDIGSTAFKGEGIYLQSRKDNDAHLATGPQQVRRNQVTLVADHPEGQQVKYKAANISKSFEHAPHAYNETPRLGEKVDATKLYGLDVIRKDIDGNIRKTKLTGKRAEKAATIIQNRAARTIQQQVIDPAAGQKVA